MVRIETETAHTDLSLDFDIHIFSFKAFRQNTGQKTFPDVFRRCGRQLFFRNIGFFIGKVEKALFLVILQGYSWDDSLHQAVQDIRSVFHSLYPPQPQWFPHPVDSCSYLPSRKAFPGRVVASHFSHDQMAAFIDCGLHIVTAMESIFAVHPPRFRICCKDSVIFRLRVQRFEIFPDLPLRAVKSSMASLIISLS